MHIFKRKRKAKAAKRKASHPEESVAIGARLTFRAEIMPGRGQAERTYTVAKVLGSGRVELVGLTGKHAVTEFETA
ncbi:MAG: hypothetical protein NVSMB56_03150 [Pyrinomonadaceae bacterium]